jgi:uncharacterized protein YacL
MFTLSYVWHGIFLNDFARLEYPKQMFLIVATFVYLLIGFIITQLYQLKYLEDKFYERPVFRGFVVGMVAGIVFFLIAFVIGISFTNQLKIKVLLFDISWQIIEQSVGGVVVGLVRLVVINNEVIEEE